MHVDVMLRIKKPNPQKSEKAPELVTKLEGAAGAGLIKAGGIVAGVAEWGHVPHVSMAWLAEAQSVYTFLPQLGQRKINTHCERSCFHCFKSLLVYLFDYRAHT